MAFVREGERVPNLRFPRVPKRPVSDFLEREVDASYYVDDPRLDAVEAGAVHVMWRGALKQNRSGDAFCLTASKYARYWRDGRGVRRLTPREHFNLQGFSPDFDISALGRTDAYAAAGCVVLFVGCSASRPPQ